jgi:HAMP domain-containing protein
MTLCEAIRQMRRNAQNDENYNWADRLEEEINTLANALDWHKAEIERLKERINGLMFDHIEAAIVKKEGK